MRRSAGILFAACLASAQATAQQLELAPSAASRCLQLLPGQPTEPEYPFVDWKGGKAGQVLVELRFTTADTRPEVTVLASSGPDSLVDAVKRHLRDYRVPCLAASDAPARLQFEYVFKPDVRKVLWSRPTDAPDPAQLAQLRCVKLPGSKGPSYPQRAMQRGVQGRLLARLRFESADQPPTIELFHRPSARELAIEVRSWAQGLRMPCWEGQAVNSFWEFSFVFDGEAYGFKPLDLLQFLRGVKDLDQQTLTVDTSDMGCPFDLKLQYRQPDLPNRVGEVGEANPARRPLIEWLEGRQLQLNAKQLDAVYADTTTVSVPCLKIDLKPKEKT